MDSLTISTNKDNQLAIVNTLTKSEIESMAQSFCDALREENDSVTALVLVKQMSIFCEKAEAELRKSASLVFTNHFPSRYGRIGSAKVELREGKSSKKYILDADTQQKIDDNNRIIAGLQADNETLKQQCIDNNKAEVHTEAGRGESIVISFDK